MANDDILIVGGGPIGLWTAIQLKAKFPDRKITILEKREEYVRGHVLNLSKSSFKSEILKGNQQYLEFLTEIGLDKKSSANVSTLVLEEKLKIWATNSGIEIKKEQVQDPKAEIVIQNNQLTYTIEGDNQEHIITAENLSLTKEEYQAFVADLTEDKLEICKNYIFRSQLETQYPNVSHFIGADGAHSIIREKVLGGISESSNLKYVFEFKYMEHQGAKPLDPISVEYPTKKLLNYQLSEFIGSKPNAEGQVPVTLMFFVDKETYEDLFKSVPEDKRNRGHKFDITKLPEGLRSDLNIWLNARDPNNTQYIPGSGVAKAFPLAAYRSEKFATTSTDKTGNTRFWGIAGDAAFGVPYLKACNNGLLSGTQLATEISAGKDAKDANSAAKNYNSHMNKFAGQEIFIAKVKSFLLSCVNFVMKKIAAYLPFIVRWDKELVTKNDHQAFVKKLVSPAPVIEENSNDHVNKFNERKQIVRRHSVS